MDFWFQVYAHLIERSSRPTAVLHSRRPMLEVQQYYCAQPRLQALQLNENPSSKGEFGIREFDEKVQNYVKKLPNVAKISKEMEQIGVLCTLSNRAIVTGQDLALESAKTALIRGLVLRPKKPYLEDENCYNYVQDCFDNLPKEAIRMKNLIFVSMCLILAISVNTVLALPGSGTQEDPWRIKSLAHFNEFAADPNYWDDWTRLEMDVNLAGQTYTTAVIAPDTDNSNWYFDGLAFTGVFNGNDYKITGLTIDDDGAGNHYLGLLGYIDGGEVRNLGLEGGSVSGYRHVGGLVGLNDGSVSSCYSTGDVKGLYEVGGLVGENYYGIVSKCYSTSDVTGDNWVGGLVGENEYGTILNCYSTGPVNGDYFVGGLVGLNWDGSVSNCYSTGDVSGTGQAISGLVGCNNRIISNCYSTCDVSGYKYVGGLVGKNYSYGIVSNCFWDTDTQNHNVTESIGYNKGTVTNVEGLPTADMQIESTFTDAGWDFTTPVWKMCELPDYPRLWWEKCPIEAAIHIKPETLNLNNKGKWISCRIRLPEDYNTADIEPDSIYLEDVIKAQGLQVNDRLATARFSRPDVQAILDVGDDVEVAISGELTDGTVFEGTDTIRVINKGGGRR